MFFEVVPLRFSQLVSPALSKFCINSIVPVRLMFVHGGGFGFGFQSIEEWNGPAKDEYFVRSLLNSLLKCLQAAVKAPLS